MTSAMEDSNQTALPKPACITPAESSEAPKMETSGITSPKSHAATLRIPQASSNQPNIKPTRRLSFDGHRFNRNMACGPDWQKYLEKKVHKKCLCYNTRTLRPRSQIKTLGEITRLESELREKYADMKEIATESRAKIVALNEISAEEASLSVEELAKKAADVALEVLKETDMQQSLIADFLKLEKEKSTAAYKEVAKMKSWKDGNYETYNGSTKRWPFVRIADLIEREAKERAGMKNVILEREIYSHASLLIALRKDKAEKYSKGIQGYQCDRYSVHLTIQVREFIDKHLQKINECIYQYDKAQVEMAEFVKTARAEYCNYLRIDPEIGERHSDHVMCILKHGTTKDRAPGTAKTIRSLEDSLFALIDREKKGSTAYDAWIARKATGEPIVQADRILFEKVWQEFFAPMEKWKKSKNRVGTVEGFIEWKKEEAEADAEMWRVVYGEPERGLGKRKRTSGPSSDQLVKEEMEKAKRTRIPDSGVKASGSRSKATGSQRSTDPSIIILEDNMQVDTVQQVSSQETEKSPTTNWEIDRVRKARTGTLNKETRRKLCEYFNIFGRHFRPDSRASDGYTIIAVPNINIPDAH